ncbi:MAG: dimethyl sulfoxide reductase anchor subunit [Chloroflexi bacterium]|nr:dimethyl sulfoxide reductase anchor subunit [Chloroflexota bacterium]
MPALRELTVDYVYQEQWGLRGRNLLIMLAIYFGGIGGGLFLVSLFGDYAQGALLGVSIAAVGKGFSHIFFLGRPERFWRAVWRPQSSWISRGFVFFGVFLVSGLAYLMPAYSGFSWLPWSSQGWLGGIFLRWLSILSAFLTVTYTGFLLGRSGIPFWNNSLLPALFAGVSLYSGAGLAGFFVRLISEAKSNRVLFEQLALWSGLAVLAMLAFYLMGSHSFNPASQRSVRYLALNRGTAWWFYGLFLALGLCLPLAVYATHTLFSPVADEVLMAVEVIEVLIGALLFRYIFFRGGIFLPVY